MDAQIARRNAHDVEPVTVLEVSHLTRCGHDSVQDDLVGQSVNGDRVLRAGRTATSQSTVAISALEHGVWRHLFRSR
jgi:hypothetical protein